MTTAATGVAIGRRWSRDNVNDRLARLAIKATLLVIGGWAPSLLAAEEPAVFSATIHALVTRDGSTTRGHRQQAVQIRVLGDASRIDFSGPGNDQAYVLALAGGTRRWLVDKASGAALPIAGAAMPLRVDPATPCATLRAHCARGNGEVIAGTIAQGWQFREAGGRGPDGTSSGTLWVDPTNGVVLGYRGEVTGRPGVHGMRAVSVSLEPLDARLLQMPQVLQAPDGSSARRPP